MHTFNILVASNNLNSLFTIKARNIPSSFGVEATDKKGSRICSGNTEQQDVTHIQHVLKDQSQPPSTCHSGRNHSPPMAYLSSTFPMQFLLTLLHVPSLTQSIMKLVADMSNNSRHDNSKPYSTSSKLPKKHHRSCFQNEIAFT